MSFFEQTDLWNAGDNGLETYYVYGIVEARGYLHVFAEGRIERHDRSPHHIVHRRSSDLGRTWEPTRIIVESKNGQCYANPVPVVTGVGDLILLYALNTDNDASQLLIRRSIDDGESWSDAEDITHLFGDDAFERTLHLPGPGHGVRLTTGRTIFPVWRRRELKFAPEDRRYGISILASDDDGETFSVAADIEPGSEMINESRIVELADGSLLLNARSGAFVESTRYQSRSFDCGQAWSRPEKGNLKPAFATDSSLVSLPNGVLLFIRPDGIDLREDLTAHTSDDGGENWLRRKVLYRGPAGYSDATVLSDGSIGVVFGCDTLVPDGDVEGNVRRTVFARFDVDWLTGEGNE